MAVTKTPVCDFNTLAPDFSLPSLDGKIHTLADCRGPKGLLVMFICNHCPYVQAILPELAEDARILINEGIGCVAIMANDYHQYPDDAPAQLRVEAKKHHFAFPYLIDETQEVAKTYGAVCTPDFFGYNKDLLLQYRGRFSESPAAQPVGSAYRSLRLAMEEIARTGLGPREQVPSMGCSIKWK